MNRKLLSSLLLILMVVFISGCKGPETPSEEPTIIIEEAVTKTVVVSVPKIEEQTATDEIPTAEFEAVVENTATETEVPTEEEIVEENTPDPGAGGQMLLESRCTECHGLGRVSSFNGSADDWTAVIERMMRKGSQLSETEKEVLINYLAETYP